MNLPKGFLEELERAAAFGLFNSMHEGYGVLMEEVEEFWEHVKVKQKSRIMSEMRKEALQVAAVALKIVATIDANGGGR